MIKLVEHRGPETQDVRDVIITTLTGMMDEDPNVVYMDADLMDAFGIRKTRASYPESIVDCGVQEANMIGVAAGLSAMGMKPYVHSFATFSTRRCFDQTFLSVGYAKNHVKILGTDPGIAATYNGGTHMCFEDLTLMRVVPGATVIEFTDSVMAEDLIKRVKDVPGVVYLRTVRKRAMAVYENGSEFEIGKGNLLRDGTDATIIACGLLVDVALRAAQLAEKEGISVRVVDMFTIKPIDKDLIIDSVAKTGAIVTAENHNVIGGLGSAVAEVMSESYPAPLVRFGVQDSYGEVGDEAYLRNRFGFTPENLLASVKTAIARKK